MTPELGHFAILSAFCFSLVQALAPLWGRHRPFYVQVSTRAAFLQFVCLLFAMLSLIACFLWNDMTVIYVRDHSHTSLPLLYRIGAAWGGHEGSLLLWCLILAGWTNAFVFSSPRALSRSFYQRIVMVLGGLSGGFILFLLATSNPFWQEVSQEPMVGADLTPVLQDPGLLFHPPMLYLGYVGFAIPFAFAMAALMEKKFDPTWAKACRPWIMLPWSFLSLGIVLGSWWAYRELGWGGWWFWDPVENASLLPWLSATALLHSLMVSEKRGVFKGWTILLALITFALSLIGTFLVRSGVLVSVHAFANDPARGLFLLGYLTVIIGGGFFYYGCRIQYFYRAPMFQLVSREMLLLINSVILLVAVATILLGTLYPILLDAFDAGKLSVGEPYFNTVFLPMVLLLFLLMGFAPHVHWRQQSIQAVWRHTGMSFLFSIAMGLALPYVCGFPFKGLASVGAALSSWIIVATLQYAYRHASLKHAAMIVAHLGIAVLALGVTFSKSYSEERQVKLQPGESVLLAGYEFKWITVGEIKKVNYNTIMAVFSVKKRHWPIGYLAAEERIYTSHAQVLSKPGILANPMRDLYVALGSPLEGHSWSVRLYYKPLVRWIWAGGFLLLLGGMLSCLHYVVTRQGVKHA